MSNTLEDADESFVIETQGSGLRLDSLLAQRFSEVKSRTYFQKLIEDGLVEVNGQAVKKRTLLKEGDEVSLRFALEPELGLKPEAIPLNILFEDDALIVVNKPAGMVVHPGAGNWSGTFANALIYHCQAWQENSESFGQRPGIVHRLDKDTSGLLIAAKTPLAHQKMVALFANREIQKTYLAIAVGCPTVERIEAPIGRHPTQRQKMTVRTEKGRQALTLLRCLAKTDQYSLLEIGLETGRTHQIRVHLQYIGHPVAGDPIYGQSGVNQKLGISRQMLHAYRLQFKHPLTGRDLTFTCPLPADMQKLLERLNLPCAY